MNTVLFSLILLAASPDIETISEAFGHIIGKHIESLDLPLDLKALAKGIEEEKNGNEAPLQEEDCLKAIAELQEAKIKELEKKNLQNAEAFLAKNKENPGITSLIPGKLQFQVVREGTGQKIQTYNSPLVHISIRTLDGQTLSSSKELLVFGEASQLFRLGMEGMREGEERMLFVHPELGIQKKQNPGTLLIYNIELIHANAPIRDEIASESLIPQ